MFSIQVDEELEKQFRRTIGELKVTTIWLI